MSAYNYVLTTGWWCDLDVDPKNRLEYFGSDNIRKADFHLQWYEAIDRFTNPKKIIIVDSDSPVPPPYNHDDDRIEHICLTENAGHPTNHKGHLSGVTRAHLYGISYALVNEVDYWVYVEQDALVYGPEIVEHCIGQMKRPYMFGSGKGTLHPVQHALMIIRKDGYLNYINRLYRIRANDQELSTERKTAIAASRWWSLLPNFFHPKNDDKSLWNQGKWVLHQLLEYCLKGYDEIPFGYGRQRPIHFEDDFFYFQHASKEELQAYGQRMEQVN